MEETYNNNNRRTVEDGANNILTDNNCELNCEIMTTANEENRTTTKYQILLAHFCTTLYVFVIIYHCFSYDEFVFFTWHPLLTSIGYMFLVSQAILIIGNPPLFASCWSKSFRIQLHWIFQTIGTTFTCVGFLIVYKNKDNLNKHHFTTWHGIFGLITCISSFLVGLGGIATLYRLRLRGLMKPKYIKLLHIIGGMVSFCFGAMCLFLGLYTKWFQRRSSDLDFFICLTSAILAVICILIRPSLNIFLQLKEIVL